MMTQKTKTIWVSLPVEMPDELEGANELGYIEAVLEALRKKAFKNTSAYFDLISKSLQEIQLSVINFDKWEYTGKIEG